MINEHYEIRNQQHGVGGTASGVYDRQPESQRGEPSPEGGTIQAEFGDQTTSAEERTGEITSQPRQFHEKAKENTFG